MSLIELLVGLAAASMVAALALTSLSMAGVAPVRKLAKVRADDEAWLGLSAIARDLREARVWEGCVGADTCAGGRAHRSPSAIVADDIRWFADNGLWRCEKQYEGQSGNQRCDKYMNGVSSLRFIADISKGDAHGISREDFEKKHGNNVEAIEIVLSTRDRSYTRTTRRPPEHAD